MCSKRTTLQQYAPLTAGSRKKATPVKSGPLLAAHSPVTVVPTKAGNQPGRWSHDRVSRGCTCLRRCDSKKLSEDVFSV